MELKNIDEETYIKFSEHHELGSFLQTIYEKNLKEIYGNIGHLVGLYDGNTLVGASLLLEIPAKFGKRIFYAPRGFLTDYQNSHYVEAFTYELKNYVKKYHGLELIIDPLVIYRILDHEEKTIMGPNDTIIEKLKKLGYRHFGFNLNFEASQVRFMYRVPVLDTYEDMLNHFTKTTRKRIESIPSKGVKVRKGDESDLETLERLLKASAENKHFEYRSLSYYQNLFEQMGNLITIYIAYIDFPYYESQVKQNLEEEKQKLDSVLQEMEKVNVGSKLRSKKELAEKHIEKYTEELEEIKKMHQTYGDKIDIGALLSIRSNHEYITLSSGMLSEFRMFNPKYAMYDAHMKDAVKEKFQYVNFYGISGNFDPKGELYGIYELKKGFNGEIVELIGEFSLPTSPLYSFYHFLLKLKNIFKR